MNGSRVTLIVSYGLCRDHAADFQILIHGDAGLSAYDLIL